MTQYLNHISAAVYIFENNLKAVNLNHTMVIIYQSMRETIWLCRKKTPGLQSHLLVLLTALSFYHSLKIHTSYLLLPCMEGANDTHSKPSISFVLQWVLFSFSCQTMSRGGKNHFLLTPGFKNTLSTGKQIVCEKMFIDHVISQEVSMWGRRGLFFVHQKYAHIHSCRLC